MPDYRLYMITDRGAVNGVREFRSHNDQQAVQEADKARAGAAAELWNLKRR